MVQYHNESEIVDAINALRKDGQNVDWLALAYVKDSKDQIELVGHGSGGVNELLKVINDDNCFYCLLRVAERVDESDTIKFVYIKYLGTRVKPMQKGRISTQTGELLKKLAPFHVSFETSTISEVNEKDIVRLVGEASLTKSFVVEKPNK
jgi:hypothetical protein